MGTGGKGVQGGIIIWLPPLFIAPVAAAPILKNIIAAALFFGSLIPLALNSKIGIIHPFIYVVGTGIPVAVFALGIMFGVKSFSKWFQKTAKIEQWTRRATGLIFILVGIYYIWAYISPIVIR